MRKGFLPFVIAMVVGFAVWVGTWGAHPTLRLLVAGDAFFAVYIGLLIAQAMRMTPERLRKVALEERASMPLTLALTGIALLLSLVAIFLLLNHPKSEGRLFPILAVASVPLSWAMLHTLAAAHYAMLYYTPDTPDGPTEGGLVFPGNAPPTGLGFLYYAFVIGMSAAVSDVSVTSRRLRLATLLHSLASFAYNTVLIAIAVNAAMTFAG